MRGLPRAILIAASLIAMASPGCSSGPRGRPVPRPWISDRSSWSASRAPRSSATASSEDLLCVARVGGIIVFARNVVDADQISPADPATPATPSRACTGRHLLVATDAEGGQVMRLGPTRGLSPDALAPDLGEDNDLAVTELEARRIGRMLAEAGIGWNLAPVVDVGYNPANPVIVGRARSFGAGPALVTSHARAYIRGMHEEGVLTALKHFPGHGSSYTDSHAGVRGRHGHGQPRGRAGPLSRADRRGAGRQRHDRARLQSTASTPWDPAHALTLRPFSGSCARIGNTRAWWSPTIC